MMKNMKYVFALSLLFSTALRAENDNSEILAQLAALRAQVLELREGQESLKSEVGKNTAWRQNVAGAMRDAFLSEKAAEFAEASARLAALEAAGTVNPYEKEGHDHAIRILEAIFGQTMNELLPTPALASVDVKTKVEQGSDDSAVLEGGASNQPSKDQDSVVITESKN